MPGRSPDKRRALAREGTLHPARARVRAALFWEHPAFFDSHDELQVKYEMLRAHFVDGQPVTAVCAAFGYSRQTFYVLRDRFARRGLAGLRDGRPGPQGPVKCTADVVAFLQAQRADDPTVSVVALMDRLTRDRGIRLHRRTVERLVGRRARKKTPHVREVPGAAEVPDATSFSICGGAAQVAYEARRTAFLAWTHHASSASEGEPPPGLGALGLAGLVTPVRRVGRFIAWPRRRGGGPVRSIRGGRRYSTPTVSCCART
jgi:transposase